MSDTDGRTPPKATRQPGRFRCLRCGAEFELMFTPGEIEERSCPACESNSVRRLKTAPESKKQ